MFSVDGKVAVVTGGAQGIGAAIARRLRRAGAQVLIIDIQDASAQARAWNCDFRQADISKRDELVASLEHAIKLHGKLDVLVNNAALAGVHSLDDIDDQRVERYYRVNALAALVGTTEAAKRMTAGGTVINMSSLAAVRATPGFCEYAMSKGAIISLTQTAALELGPRGIRVNAICPGGIMSWDPADPRGDPLRRALNVLTPLGRIGTPDEIAAMVHFLASDDASYVTGQAYFVDGGWSLGTTVQEFGLAVANG